jgi:lipopolysaccharide transport system ATP-binding protein
VPRRTITVRARSDITAGNVTIGMRIADSVGVEIYGTNTRLLGHALDVRAGERFEVVFHLDLRLAAGTYDVTVAIHAGTDHLETCYHWIDNATHFVVSPPPEHYFTGVVDLRASAAVRRLQSNGRDTLNGLP